MSVEAGAVVAGFAASPAFGAAAFVAAGAFVTAGAFEFALAAGAGALVVATGLAGAFAFVNEFQARGLPTGGEHVDLLCDRARPGGQ